MGDWLEDEGVKDWLHITDVTHGKLGSRTIVQARYETRLDHSRREAASLQLVARLDDIADAIWTLSDKTMPQEEKTRSQALLSELDGIVKTLPQPVAVCRSRARSPRG